MSLTAFCHFVNVRPYICLSIHLSIYLSAGRCRTNQNNQFSFNLGRLTLVTGLITCSWPGHKSSNHDLSALEKVRKVRHLVVIFCKCIWYLLTDILFLQIDFAIHKNSQRNVKLLCLIVNYLHMSIKY